MCKFFCQPVSNVCRSGLFIIYRWEISSWSQRIHRVRSHLHFLQNPQIVHQLFVSNQKWAFLTFHINNDAKNPLIILQGRDALHYSCFFWVSHHPPKFVSIFSECFSKLSHLHFPNIKILSHSASSINMGLLPAGAWWPDLKWNSKKSPK